jgi:hypothetical protein
MIIVHSAHARHVVHHLAALPAGQSIENEQLFESYTTTGADAAWVGTGPMARPSRPGRLAWSRPPRPAPAPCPLPAAPACPARAQAHRQGKQERLPASTCPRRSCFPPPRPAEASPGRPAPPLCPSPGRLPTAPAGPAATPGASAACCGWNRPRTAGDSGGAPHEFLEARTRLYPWASHSPPLPRADQTT